MRSHIPKKALTLGTGPKKGKSVAIQQTNTNSSTSGSRSMFMFELERTETGATKIGKLVLRPKKDNLPQ